MQVSNSEAVLFADDLTFNKVGTFSVGVVYGDSAVNANGEKNERLEWNESKQRHEVSKLYGDGERRNRTAYLTSEAIVSIQEAKAIGEAEITILEAQIAFGEDFTKASLIVSSSFNDAEILSAVNLAINSQVKVYLRAILQERARRRFDT